MSRILLISLLFLATNLYANPAPIDFDNDLYTDPSVVVISDKLTWKSIVGEELSEISDGFGKPGEHLAPGNYTGNGTIPATITSEGNWKLMGASNLQFGDNDSLFLAGSDFSGDGLTDLAVASNVCQSKRSVFKVIANPVGSLSLKISEFKASKGNYYKFYMDADGNGSNEACTLVGLKTNRKLTGKFKAVCKNTDGNKVKVFRAGKVNAQPHNVKISGGADLLVIPLKKKTFTKLKFIDHNGTKYRKVKLPAVGTVVVGNFTSIINQQVAVVNEETNQALVYDPISDEIIEKSFPEGIAYDQINIVHFKSSEDCFCSSRDIQRNGNCERSSSAGNLPQTPDTPGNTGSVLYIPDNCADAPEHISQFDGFKCIASATRGGSVVCLLPYQFTWAPFKSVTDHHGYTFACNRNGDAFSKVDLVLKSGQSIPMSYAGCHNYVSTPDGAVGRQHFRNEGVRWDSIRGKADRLVMQKNGKSTCLKF